MKKKKFLAGWHCEYREHLRRSLALADADILFNQNSLAHHATQAMEVVVIKSEALHHTITLDLSGHTVWEVKKKIFKEEGLHPIMQQAFLGDQEIPDVWFLSPGTNNLVIKPSNNTYDILAKDHLDRSYKLKVQANNVIEAIKAGISAYAGPDCLLLFEGKELEDDRTLFDYRIGPEKVVSMHLYRQKQQFLMTTVNRQDIIECHVTDHLMDLQLKVATLGIPLLEQRVMHHTNPDGTITYEICDGTIISDSRT